MKKSVNTSHGFGAVAALAICAVLAIVGLVGWAVYAHSRNPTKSNAQTSSHDSQAKKTTTTVDPYAGWKTYLDTGYSRASGISIKYPSDWQINVGNSKAFAWVIVHSAAPQGSIDVRTAYLDSSKSPQQEWDNCPSADACGPTPGDTKLEGSSASINGLDSYKVKMQTNSGTYYATVIKGTKPSSNGTTAFVEFLLYSDDSTLLHT